MTDQKNRAGLSEEMEQDCILFQGKLNEKGYGLTTLNGKSIGAHRKAWIKTHGQIPSGHVVMHLCRNRNCINPKHLDAMPRHRANLFAFEMRRSRMQEIGRDKFVKEIYDNRHGITETKTVYSKEDEEMIEDHIAIMTGKKRRY